MKILLTAINAKYIHSNLAVYSLQSYAKKYGIQVSVAEYTINHRTEFILQQLYQSRPDVLMFSCYIWNISCVCELMEEIHKLMPKLPIWVGGPEVSFECEAFLTAHPMVTGIMRGEGEATFRELCGYYENCAKGKPGSLAQIPGITYREATGEPAATPERKPLELDEIPFCYEDLGDFENRIIYYESSRGCPFCCSYCLSSVEKSLRFRSLELVKKELQFFLDRRVPQVKFVDRTFNCNHRHAMAIWQYLKDHDNGITNFHFEISADLLTEEELRLLAGLRPGLVQLEIGVQTTNPQTVTEIRRTMNLERLEEVVRRIKEPGNIHQHLDLIAGLPFEDYAGFQKSFDRIYRLHPQQLQLGFLKVLKGSFMYENRKQYGLVYHSLPPYEVMATSWISYDEILKIKKAEEMLEVYYNSGQYEITVQILEQSFPSPFQMYLALGEYYDKRNLFQMNHSRVQRCEILLDFLTETDPGHLKLYQEALTFDLYYRENLKRRTAWMPEPSLYKEKSRQLSERLFHGRHKVIHLEPFSYDFTRLMQGKQEGYPVKQETPDFYLFDYEDRSRLTGQAKVVKIEETEESVQTQERRKQ